MRLKWPCTLQVSQNPAPGRREGRLQERIELLEEMLPTKFGALDDSVRSRLYEANSEDLLRWGTRLLTAESLGDVFGSDDQNE